MRITAVTTWLPTEVAPSRGSFVVRDLHSIARHHDVRIVHLVPPQDDDQTRRLSIEGIETLRIPMNPRRPDSILWASKQLRAALVNADIVHSMAFSSLLPLSLRGPRCPWVHTEHWSAITSPGTLPAAAQAALPAVLQLLARPTTVTAVCEYLATPIRQVRGTRPTTVVPCVVDPHPLDERRDRSDGQLRLISTGGLIDRKDPLVAVRTVAELVVRGVDAHLDWVGEGPLRAEVDALATQLGISSRILLLGSKSPTEVRAALGAADLFFGPTKADNFFVSAAEAIVAGRPVVLGSTGGQGEYVDPSIGALIGVQSPGAYADAIQDVDRRTRDLTSEQISATIGDAFSTETVGRGYAETYEQVRRPPVT